MTVSHISFLKFQARHSPDPYLQIKVQKEKPGRRPYSSIDVHLRSTLQVGQSKPKVSQDQKLLSLPVSAPSGRAFQSVNQSRLIKHFYSIASLSISNRKLTSIVGIITQHTLSGWHCLTAILKILVLFSEQEIQADVTGHICTSSSKQFELIGKVLQGSSCIVQRPHI